MPSSDEKWGFVRETREKATGFDRDTGVCRTGLDDYLAVIFPDVTDWAHDKVISPLPSGVKSRRRPDYRSETLKLIIEFDGVQHYQKPSKIRKDSEATSFYESLGYKVVRIPFFIQLTNQAVEVLFGVRVNERLFDESVPSLGPKGVTPAQLSLPGIVRMAKEFRRFPEQYAVNLNRLKEVDEELTTGAILLESVYDLICNEGNDTSCRIDLKPYFADQ